MATAVALPIRAARDQACLVAFAVDGLDATGATLSGFVKLEKGTPGAPLLVLPQVAAQNTLGLRPTGVEKPGTPQAISRFELCIPKAKMATLPAPEEPGDDAAFYYQIDLTLPGVVVPVRLYGLFTVAYDGGLSVGGEHRLSFGPQQVVVRVDRAQGPRGPAGPIGSADGSLDEMSLADFDREDGDDSIGSRGGDMPRLYRLRDAATDAGKRQFVPEGEYQVFENGQAVDPEATGLLSVNGYRMRGAGRDRTTFVGNPDVAYVLYANGCKRGTVADPAITNPGDPGSTKDLDLGHFTIVHPGGFLESSAAIGLFGVENAYIHDFAIRGFTGDAITIGTAEFGDGSQIAQNRKVLIERGIIDGLNKNNRQGLTLNNIDELTVRDVEVNNTTRPGNGNVTPAERDDPDTGPPQPGSMDMELINGGMVVVTFRKSLFENFRGTNSGGSLLVYNFSKANRTDPPFDGQDGRLDADVSTLIHDHQAYGLSCDGYRLGLVSADAPPEAAVGFGVQIRGFVCSNADRSLSITRFRGMIIANGTFYRSKYASELGYTGDANKRVNELDFDDISWVQTGLLDGLTLAVYGCDRMTMRRQRVIDANNVWMRISGTNRTKNLLIDDIKFLATGYAGLPICTNSIIVVPNDGETLNDAINRLVEVRTVEIRNAEWNGVAPPNFPYRDGLSPSVPEPGAWLTGDRVNCTSIDPGAPMGWEALIDNVLPAKPRWKTFGTKGVPQSDPAADTGGWAFGAGSGIITRTNNRFDSIDNNQVITAVPNGLTLSMVSGCEAWVRGFFDRTALLFFGFKNKTAGGGTGGLHGIWADGRLGGTRQRVAFVNGGQQALQGSFAHDIVTRVRLYTSQTYGPVMRIYSATYALALQGSWTPTGSPIAVPNGSGTDMQFFMLFASSGESAQVIKLATGSGSND